LANAGFSRLDASSVPPDPNRPDDGVDLVDEQDAVRIVLELLEHGFEALLEIAAVFGAGQQCAHVERIHHGILQDFRHIAWVMR
jgi:hypothetical protein